MPAGLFCMAHSPCEATDEPPIAALLPPIGWMKSYAKSVEVVRIMENKSRNLFMRLWFDGANLRLISIKTKKFPIFAVKTKTP